MWPSICKVVLEDPQWCDPPMISGHGPPVHSEAFVMRTLHCCPATRCWRFKIWEIYEESTENLWRILFSFSESNAPIPFTVAPWRIDYRHILFDFIPEMAPSMIPNMCNPPTQPWFLGVLNFSGIRLYIHYPISNVGHFDIVHVFGTQRQPFHLWNFGAIMKNTMCLGHSISICCLKITETHPIPS